MASLLDREHYEGNVLDAIAELRARIEALERTDLSGVAGPQGLTGPQGPQGPTGSPGPGAPSPLTQGDVLVVDSTPEIATLGIGNAHEILKVNAAGTDPAWEPFDWDEMSGVGGADMVHSHQSAAEGDKLDHGATLNGLSDDDHTQYLLASGVRDGAAIQRQHFTNPISTGDGITVGQDVDQAGQGEIASYDGSSLFMLERGGGGGAGSQGLIARTGANPASGESIFEVRSSGGAVRLFVAHDGLSYFGDHLAVAKGLWVGSGSTPDDDDVHIDGSINLSTSHSCRAHRTTDQSIPTATWTSIIFDAVQHDTGDDNWVVGTPTRVTAQRAGSYLISAYAQWDASGAGGRRLMRLRLNGATNIANIEWQPEATNDLAGMLVATDYELSASDYLEVQVYQNTGGPLNIDAALIYPCLTLTRLP